MVAVRSLALMPGVESVKLAENVVFPPCPSVATFRAWPVPAAKPGNSRDVMAMLLAMSRRSSNDSTSKRVRGRGPRVARRERRVTRLRYQERNMVHLLEEGENPCAARDPRAGMRADVRLFRRE